MGDIIFGAEAGYLLADEVGSVIRDDNVENPEAAHYILPEELDNLLIIDLGEWYYLNPLGKVISGNQ